MNNHDSQNIERRFVRRSRRLRPRQREKRRATRRTGRPDEGQQIHHPQSRDARGAESASFEARRPRRPRLFSTGRRTARQPADGRNRRGVSLRHGHPKHAVHHRPPPRPGTSPPAYPFQPGEQRRPYRLRPQRPLPFGATLQGADRPARALLRIGQRECQGAPPARTGQDEIRDFPRAAQRRTPLPRLTGADGSATARRDRHRVPDARRNFRPTRRRFRQERLPVQRFENRPAVQFLQNRPCAEPEPPTSTLRKRTRPRKQSGRIVQSPARRSSATGLRYGRRTAPSGATAQKEKTPTTLNFITYGDNHRHRALRRTEKADRRARPQAGRPQPAGPAGVFDTD